MQKIFQKQWLEQKLSPQQIQFIKLLQLSTTEFEQRVDEELEENPSLEESNEQEELYSEDSNELDDEQESNEYDDEFDLKDYLSDDDVGGYKLQSDNGGEDEDREIPIAAGYTVFENLKTQLGYVRLDEKKYSIGLQLIGSIDEDGYIRRNLSAIVNDLAFTQNIQTTEEEVESVLNIIQQFDPSGIGARDLQECLLLQLERKSDESEDVAIAEEILKTQFEAFTKKHYSKITSKLNISEEQLKHALDIILKLNPKPGGSSSGSTSKTAQYLIPDFTVVNENGNLRVLLNSRNAPELRVSRTYSEMFDTYDKSNKKDKKLKEAVTFVKQKLDAAKWFIDAIQQRQITLLSTMNAIVQYQKEFFLEGDESSLKPMILKDIAEKVNLDISTISRVSNSKSVETEFGVFPLKFFFSEGISTDSGEEVSSREVKSVLKQIIDSEDKLKPLSDEKIAELINEKGYNLARRTVAKYREQLNIPVARLRKEL